MKQHTIKAYLYKGEKQFVAECLDIPVVTQGKTVDETLKNLQEAVALHLALPYGARHSVVILC